MNKIAQKIHRELKKIEKAGDEPIRELELSYELAWELALEDAPQSRIITQATLEKALPLNLSKIIGFCHRNLSYLLMLDGDLKNSLLHGERAMVEFDKTGEAFGQATTCDILIHSYMAMGKLDKATEMAFRTKDLCTQIGYTRGEAYAHMNLGIIYHNSGDNKKAQAHFEKAARMFREISYDVGLCWTNAHMATVFLALELYEKAAQAINVGLRLLYEHKVPAAASLILTEYGKLLLATKEPVEALAIYEKELAAFGDWQDGGFQSYHFLNLAKLHRLLGHDEQALEFLKKAKRKVETYGLTKISIEVYKEMAELYERDRKYKSALDFHKKYAALERETSSLESQVEVKNLQLKHELDVAEQNNELERLQIVEAGQKELAAAHAEVQRLKDRLKAENLYLQEEIKNQHNFNEIVTQSASMNAVLHQVEQVAVTSSTVLVLGESGTGKELLARAIHDLSPRKDRALVKVNCAAIPESLIESELFGHERGAFTDAKQKKLGKFALADKGTMFLDEIGELDLSMQSKLLRVLQEGEIQPLGATTVSTLDVRIIAATNRDLLEMVHQKTFREDLYYRLFVFPIKLPPLRERKDDIPLLVQHFTSIKAKKMGKYFDSIAKDFMEQMVRYDWPGNIRELENTIERAVILANGSRLTGHLPAASAIEGSTPALEVTQKPDNDWSLKSSERALMEAALKKTDWIIKGPKGAAVLLGIPPSTLRDKIRRYGLVKA